MNLPIPSSVPIVTYSLVEALSMLELTRTPCRRIVIFLRISIRGPEIATPVSVGPLSGSKSLNDGRGERRQRLDAVGGPTKSTFSFSRT